MAISRQQRPHYDFQADLDKIENNWRKVGTFMESQQWSGAIVRAATAAEIAANLAVRFELVDQRHLSPEFVDHLLRWANGIQGKFDRLLLPVSKAAQRRNSRLKALRERLVDVNKQRNEVVHMGSFKKKSDATKIVEEARQVILGLVAVYVTDFQLDDVRP